MNSTTTARAPSSESRARDCNRWSTERPMASASSRFCRSRICAIEQELLAPLTGRLKVRVIVGDVRAMHQLPENAGAVFQVASQFIFLEMTGPYVTPEMASPATKAIHTQGPACAIAARRRNDLPKLFRPGSRRVRPDGKAPARRVEAARKGPGGSAGSAGREIMDDGEWLRPLHPHRARRHLSIPDGVAARRGGPVARQVSASGCIGRRGHGGQRRAPATGLCRLSARLSR